MIIWHTTMFFFLYCDQLVMFCLEVEGVEGGFVQAVVDREPLLASCRGSGWDASLLVTVEAREAVLCARLIGVVAHLELNMLRRRRMGGTEARVASEVPHRPELKGHPSAALLL